LTISTNSTTEIEVCLSPELLHLHDLQGKIVVVTDIFRATSCIVTALANGVDHIVPVAKLEECLALRNQGYDLAGERNGEMVEGFDLGNSPYHYLDAKYSGRKIAMTTTNGTVALTMAAHSAKQVIVGSFLNIKTVANYLRNRQESVVIVCAGWKGKFSMEDSLFAGALVEDLSRTHAVECDAALATQSLIQLAKYDLFSYLQKSSHYLRLSKLGLEKDMKFCLQFDLYPILPVFVDGKLRVS
jgi:2-phosphosulfolactate phosphatase